MATLFRRRNDAVTAAAQIIEPKSLYPEGPSSSAGVQTWQKMAWSYYDTLPEIRYPTRFIGSMLSRFLFRIAVLNEDDPTAPPVVPDRPDATAKLAETTLRDLQGPFGGLDQIAKRWAMNMMLPGEGWLIGTDVRDETEWEFLSVSEFTPATGVGDNSAPFLRNHYGDPTSASSVEVDPEYVRRFWIAHPRFSYAPDSAMKSLGDYCEQLKQLNDSITARIVSRLISAGIMFVPSSLSLPGLTNVPVGDGQAVDDPFAHKLMNSLERQVLNREKAVLPVLVRGPGEAGEQIRHITMDRAIDEVEMKLRAELRQTIAVGLDLPPEVQTQLGESNHFQSWSIEDATVRSHLQPAADDFASGLTRVYVWPALGALGVTPLEYRKLVVIADPANVVMRPNMAEDGRQLYDRITLSEKSLRERSGVPEDDAPSEEERVRLIGVKQNNLYAATFGLAVQQKIDWELYAKGTSGRSTGAPGVGSIDEGHRPADSSDPAGAPGEGTPGTGDLPGDVERNDD